MVLPALFLIVWSTFVLLMLAGGYRRLERWWEFKRWGRQPTYQYYGNEVPAIFPVDLLADAVLFVHVHNSVLWTVDGIRHVAFDLETPSWSRRGQWTTIVAAEGHIEAHRPWPYAEEATALQGSGWVVLTPRRKALDRKLWLMRMLDSFPPRDRLLEPDVIFDLWERIDAVAVRSRAQ